LRRYDAALQHCRELYTHDSVWIGTTVLPLLVEAAAHCGDVATAEAALDRLSERASTSGSHWAQGLLARSRALLATYDDAEAQFRIAIDHLTRCTAAMDRAITQLVYGEWLRRARRRREARGPLRAAIEFFETAGARAFADRTRIELVATGEHARPRSDATRDLLTPHEARIGRLAAAGLTNAEIASELYLSTSTVEYHLSKIYRKLGVTTRTQLAGLDLPE
jgi:DNA-binding CsgD family transcriptional regulator